MSRSARVEGVIRAAWRRSLLLLVFEHTAYPCTALLAGIALLLLFGTDILNWYWPAALTAAATVFAAFRIRRGILSRYRLAQVLDTRLGLSDSLATAWFLLSQNSRRDSVAAVFQIRQAEELVGSIQPAAALPFTGGRMWAATACMAAVALGLFGIRYFKVESLSLRLPLIPAHAAVIADVEQWFSSGGWRPLFRHADRQNAADANQFAPRERNTNNASEPGDTTERADRKGAATNANHAEENRRGTSQTAGAHASQSEQPASPSLLSRMKDQLSSLMAQLRGGGQGKRSAESGAQAEDRTTNRETSPPANSQSSNQQASNAQSQARAAQKQGSDLRNSQASQKGSEARSGIGSQNGDKDLKRAQELAAMGKLTEILGKRSAELTGDMSVRTVSGTTELQTPYVEQMARHSDLGGEIHRDEIPPAYRDYVRRYMEEVHKGAD